MTAEIIPFPNAKQREARRRGGDIPWIAEARAQIRQRTQWNRALAKQEKRQAKEIRRYVALREACRNTELIRHLDAMMTALGIPELAGPKPPAA